MSVERKGALLDRLVEAGREKGYLTFSELDELLPAGMVSPEELDDVMGQAGAGKNIQVADRDAGAAARPEESPPGGGG